jgi:hypothetical protein
VIKESTSIIPEGKMEIQNQTKPNQTKKKTPDCKLGEGAMLRKQ